MIAPRSSASQRGERPSGTILARAKATQAAVNQEARPIIADYRVTQLIS
jgi:hypothetical protein